MIDTKKWRENLRQMIFENEWCFRDIEERMLLDEIDRLTAELDRYRWLPYPANKPSEETIYQVTVEDATNEEPCITRAYWNGDYWSNHLYCTVTAYRPRPEAYKPPSSEVTQ